jgi:hypothetical protein
VRYAPAPSGQPIAIWGRLEPSRPAAPRPKAVVPIVVVNPSGEHARSQGAEPAPADHRGAGQHEDPEDPCGEPVGDHLVEVMGRGGLGAGGGFGVVLLEVRTPVGRVGDARGVAAHEGRAGHRPHTRGERSAGADGDEADTSDQRQGQDHLQQDHGDGQEPGNGTLRPCRSRGRPTRGRACGLWIVG